MDELTREAYQYIRRLGYWDRALPKRWPGNPNQTAYPETMFQLQCLLSSSAINLSPGIPMKEDTILLESIGDDILLKQKLLPGTKEYIRLLYERGARRHRLLVQAGP